MRERRISPKDDLRTPAVEPTQAQLTRGLMLAMLAESYPTHRAESGMKAEIGEVFLDVQGWDQHVSYLEESGYITVEEQALGPKYAAKFRLRSFRITKRGLDLLDGVIPADPGICTTPE